MKLLNVRGFIAASLAAACFGSGYALAAPPFQTLSGGQAAALKDLGSVDPATEVNLTVFLKPSNEAQYHEAVEALYDPSSPTYHQWFTDADFEKYAPSQEQFQQLKNQLVAQGFSVVSSDPHRFSLRVHGTVGIAQNAFQTEVHTYTLPNGHSFRGTTRAPALAGAAGSLVKAVAGLERHKAKPRLSFQINPTTGLQVGPVALAQAQDDGGVLSYITGTALAVSQAYTYSDGAGNTATFSGTIYNPSGLWVSYTPQQLQAHYGLTDLINRGYDGTGQTIALVVAYGYDAAESDANLAAQTFGLPALTSDTFSVTYPEGPPLNTDSAVTQGWVTEIALDIQAAHGIAPGAKIAVIASSGQDDEDFLASLEYIIDNKVSNIVSNSWEIDDEIIAGSTQLDAFNSILEKGAAAGISFQFATGDNGDLGLGTPAGAVGVPADSPYAVAVGGTSVFNNPYGPGDIVTGWGTAVADFVLTSPLSSSLPVGSRDFFIGGAGGGQSQYFAKPKWQKHLPGSYRQVPDVSAVADSFTGYSVFESFVTGYTSFQGGLGGTSLASPVFSAIWAIASQYNGKPLGFAAPIIAELKPGEITDVQPASPLNQYNVAGTVTGPSGTSTYTPQDLFSDVLGNSTQFLATASPWGGSNGTAIAFGLDTSLTVTPGWDNVTGFGEPNGLPFIQAVSKLAQRGGGNGNGSNN